MYWHAYEWVKKSLLVIVCCFWTCFSGLIGALQRAFRRLSRCWKCSHQTGNSQFSLFLFLFLLIFLMIKTKCIIFKTEIIIDRGLLSDQVIFQLNESNQWLSNRNATMQTAWAPPILHIFGLNITKVTMVHVFWPALAHSCASGAQVADVFNCAQVSWNDCKKLGKKRPSFSEAYLISFLMTSSLRKEAEPERSLPNKEVDFDGGFGPVTFTSRMTRPYVFNHHRSNNFNLYETSIRSSMFHKTNDVIFAESPLVSV